VTSVTDHDAYGAYDASDDSDAPDDRIPGPGSGSVPEAQEHELRVLLERAVPQLPAPAQRLASVRERVRRRRRRRAAGVSVTAVIAIAAAGMLLPGLGDRDGGPSSAASSPAGPPSGSAPASTPAPPVTAPPGYTVEPFDELARLRVVMPQEWNGLIASDTPRGYVSTQSLGLPKGGCAHQLDDFCTPLDRTLTPDGVLVQFTLVAESDKVGKALLRGDEGTVAVQQVLSACRAVGGTEQLGVTVVRPPGATASDGATDSTDSTGPGGSTGMPGSTASPGYSMAVVATACLSHPRGAQEARVRALLNSASFS
jgi:hypothetical protein